MEFPVIKGSNGTFASSISKSIIELYDSIWFLWLSYITRENRSSEKKLLVGGAITILTNMSSSMGRIIPIWKKKHVPNHQPNSFHLHFIFFVEIPMFIIVVIPWPIPMFQTTNQFCSQFPTSKRISGHPEKNHGLQGASLPSSVNQLNRPSCVTSIGL